MNDWVGYANTIAATAAALGIPTIAVGLFNKLTAMKEAQRKHELDIFSKVEVIAQRFDLTVKEIQATSREDSRETVKTLLGIQRDTVNAVAELSKEVHSLSLAVAELRK